MTNAVTYRTLCRRAERYAIIGQAYRRWYRVARAVIGRLVRLDYPDYPEHVQAARYRRLCDIVAITSPRVGVKRNLRFAYGEFTGLPRPSDMMTSIRLGLEHYYRTGEIRGPKTSRFARVLRGADNVVVVDTWMARALSVPDRQARNKATQELAERVIGHVARKRGWPLSDTQAAVWAGVIRTHYKDGVVPIIKVADALPDVPF